MHGKEPMFGHSRLRCLDKYRFAAVHSRMGCPVVTFGCDVFVVKE